MGFPVLVIDEDFVTSDRNIVLFTRSVLVAWIVENLDGLVVVVKLHVFDGIQSVVGRSVDTEANTGMSLENERSTQSDNLGDLHDERWIGWLVETVFGEM